MIPTQSTQESSTLDSLSTLSDLFSGPTNSHGISTLSDQFSVSRNLSPRRSSSGPVINDGFTKVAVNYVFRSTFTYSGSLRLSEDNQRLGT